MLLLLVLGMFPTCFADGRKEFIVGGDNVDIASFPWQGSYRFPTGVMTCGCVFIGGRWSLTAAHCAGDTGYTVEFGSTTRGSGEVFGITQVTRHPNYNIGRGFYPNDITVLRSIQEIAGENISPATVSNTPDNPGGLGWITGWGCTCATGNPECTTGPLNLKGAELPIVEDNLCASIHSNNFQPDNMICVWEEETQNKAAGTGDSGGPLTQGDILLGLMSWTTTGCGTQAPTVYTKVGAFYDWICEETNNQASGC